MSKNQTNFSPSANQLAMLKVVEDGDYGVSVTDACKAVGIARQSYYEWFDNPEFVTWWTACYERHFALQLPRVHVAMVNLAMGTDKEPNAQAIKLVLERFDKGYVPRTKREIEGSVEISFEDRLEKLRLAAAAEVAEDDDEEPDGNGD